MNIIKFQDVIIEDDATFNSVFKGKYAYCINWKYIFPLDKISNSVYIQISQDESLISNYIEGTDYIVYEEYVDLIDEVETNKINQVAKYIYLNEFTTDEDITIDELKQFRKWLADILYTNSSFIEEYTDDTYHLYKMLEYYKANMTDCTIIGLNSFTSIAPVDSISNSKGCECGYSSPSYSIKSTPSTTINGIAKSAGCGCGNNTLYTGISTTICDPVSIYRQSIYNYMVRIFSDINYWLGQVSICIEMKKYIDGIIKCNFPLTSSVTDTFSDCTCTNIDATEQERLMRMLSNLSQALNYIINEQVSGNRNFISTAFSNWSMYLYEKMYWE